MIIYLFAIVMFQHGDGGGGGGSDDGGDNDDDDDLNDSAEDDEVNAEASKGRLLDDFHRRSAFQVTSPPGTTWTPTPAHAEGMKRAMWPFLVHHGVFGKTWQRFIGPWACGTTEAH